MPHVLLAIRGLDTGGAERRCLLLANALVNEGYPVSLLVMRPAENPIGQPDPRIRVVSADLTNRRSLAGWRRFYRAIRQLRPTVFQGFDTTVGFVGGVLARLAGVPLVINAITCHNGRYPRWQAALARFCFRFTDYAIANSRDVADFHIRDWRFAAEKVVVIPNPIDLGRWPCREPALRRAARAELGLDEAQQAVGVVARLDAQKDHATLLAAFAAVAPAHPEAVLLVIGEGPLQTELEATAARLGISAQTRFLGLRQDMPRLLQALDLLCLSSRYEGMSNALLEGMATGLPVISTAVSGTAELIVPERTGWVVPIGDPAAFAAALSAALADRARLAAYGQAGREHVAGQFDRPVIVQRYLEFYAQALASTAAQR